MHCTMCIHARTKIVVTNGEFDDAFCFIKGSVERFSRIIFPVLLLFECNSCYFTARSNATYSFYRLPCLTPPPPPSLQLSHTLCIVSWYACFGFINIIGNFPVDFPLNTWSENYYYFYYVLAHPFHEWATDGHTPARRVRTGKTFCFIFMIIKCNSFNVITTFIISGRLRKRRSNSRSWWCTGGCHFQWQCNLCILHLLNELLIDDK